MRYKICETLHIPPDIIAGSMLVSLQDNHHVFVENYSSLIQYTPEIIRIQGKNCRLIIKGQKLDINYYSDEDCSIKGHITSIGYE